MLRITHKGYPYVGLLGNSNVKFTPEGGLAIRLINKTGAVSEKGRLVHPASIDNAVAYTIANDFDCIGMMYDNGIVDGDYTWIVVAGIADILLEDNVGSNADDWLGISLTENGYAQASAIPSGNVALHFREVGHCIKTVSAGGPGTHVLSRGVIHFN